MSQFIYPANYAKTQYGSTNVAADAAESYMSSPSFNDGGFQQGFRVGYTAVDATFAPWLAYKGAKYEKRLMKMQQELATLQANRYRTAAEDAMRAGHDRAAAIGFDAGQAKGNVRVAQGAGGVRVAGSGSSAEVLASIDIVKEIRINQTLANAVTQAWGYRIQAVDSDNRALAYEYAAKSISPWASAISTAFKKAASMSSGSGGSATFADFGSFAQGLGQGQGGAPGYGLQMPSDGGGYGLKMPNSGGAGKFNSFASFGGK